MTPLANAARIIGRAVATTASTLLLGPTSASTPRATTVRALSSRLANGFPDKDPATPRPERIPALFSGSTTTSTISSTALAPPLVLSVASPSVGERVQTVQQLLGPPPRRMLTTKVRKGEGENGSHTEAAEIEDEISRLEASLALGQEVVRDCESFRSATSMLMGTIKKAKKAWGQEYNDAVIVDLLYTVLNMIEGRLDVARELESGAKADLDFWKSRQTPPEPEAGSGKGKGKKKKGKKGKGKADT